MHMPFKTRLGMYWLSSKLVKDDAAKVVSLLARG